MKSRRHRIPVSLAALVIAGGIAHADARHAYAQRLEDRTVESSSAELITPQAEAAMKSGLKWLAQRQHEDGSLGSGGHYPRNVAITALGGMAFLSAGHTPDRGPYGQNVRRIVDFLLSRSRPNGLIIAPKSASHGPMYGHGFATLFLAEAYGMTEDEDIRDKLDKAVTLIVNTQNDEGGWRYEPEPKDADISVTVCQVMALRAARNAGIYVPKTTIDKSVEYVKQCQNPDGGFRYQLRGLPESAFPRSAAALVALYSAGIYEGREIGRGLEFMMRRLPQGNFVRETHYFYGHYYAVQAAWHAGGDYWQTWYPAIRDELITRQMPDGSWPDPTNNSEYATAMACLVLQLPNNYLPIFQR